MSEIEVKSGSQNRLHPMQMAIFIILEMLLLFGVKFSKFHLLGPLHLYDLIIAISAIIALYYYLRRGDKSAIWSIFFLLLISLIYLFYSFLMQLGPVDYMLRQYTLFIYLGAYYFIFFSFISKEAQKTNVRFLILFAFCSFLIQVITHVYNFISIENYKEVFFEDFNYHSLPTILGILIFLCYELIFDNNTLRKVLLVLIVIILSVSIGHHGSTILATSVILGLYVFLHIGKIYKYLSLAFIPILGYLLFFYLPQFQDVNSLWRLIYWKYTINDIITEYYGILGHGFGGPYITQETMTAMREELNSTWMETRPIEQFITPMHNSFLTIAFYIGLLPSLLVFIPAIPIIKYYFERNKSTRSKKSDFLFLVFMGVTIWISFHVTLELPHLSGVYWFIYFTSVYHFGIKYFKERKFNILTFGMRENSVKS